MLQPACRTHSRTARPFHAPPGRLAEWHVEIRNETPLRWRATAYDANSMKRWLPVKAVLKRSSWSWTMLQPTNCDSQAMRCFARNSVTISKSSPSQHAQWQARGATRRRYRPQLFSAIPNGELIAEPQPRYDSHPLLHEKRDHAFVYFFFKSNTCSLSY
jgi:hypothetical protein